jgi:tetratricopeptide (TPR) repeat protein
LKYNYKKRLCQLHLIEGAYNFFVKEDTPNSFKILKNALRESEEAGEYISLIMANSYLGSIMGLNCEFDKALESHKSWMYLYKQTKKKWGMALCKSNQSFFIFNFQGKTDLAFKMSEEAVQLAEDSGDIFSKAHAFTCHGRSLYQKGLLNDAEKFLIEGSNFCNRIKLFGCEAFAQWTLGDVYYEIGDYEKSKTCYLDAASLLNEVQFLPSFMNANKIAAARSMVMNNENDVNLETIHNYVSKNKIKIYEGWMHHCLGGILLHIDGEHLNEADECIRHAIEVDQRNDTMFFLGKDYALYAELLKQKGDTLKTKENLSKAIDIFTECGADGWVEKTEEKLAKL